MDDGPLGGLLRNSSRSAARACSSSSLALSPIRICLDGLAETRTALAPRDNVTPSELKKKPGTSTKDVKRAAELTAKLKKGEEFLATVVNKEDGGLAADEEEGMDDALLDLVWEFGAKI